MSWFRNAVRKWLEGNPTRENTKIVVSRYSHENTVSFDITQASNGYIISARKYDQKTDKSSEVTRICIDGGSVIEEITTILAEIKLR